MPGRAPRFCPHCQRAFTGPRCPCRTEARQRYDRDRGPDRHFYSTPRWRRFRKRILARDMWCVLCPADRKRLATIVDHIIPRKERPDLAYSAENCRGLCVSCHNRRSRVYGRERTRAE